MHAPGASRPLCSKLSQAWGSRPLAKGGSRNTSSKAAGCSAVCRSQSQAGRQWICAFSAPSNRAFSASAAQAALLRSTMITRAAPLESASKPRAPLPANKSRQVAPGTSARSQLNRVSRMRSGVGRRPSPSGNRSSRLRNRPPIMRTVFLRRRFCFIADTENDLSGRRVSTAVGGFVRRGGVVIA